MRMCASSQNTFHSIPHGLGLVLGFTDKIAVIQVFKVPEEFGTFFYHFASVTNMHIWFGKLSGFITQYNSPDITS